MLQAFCFVYMGKWKVQKFKESLLIAYFSHRLSFSAQSCYIVGLNAVSDMKSVVAGISFDRQSRTRPSSGSRWIYCTIIMRFCFVSPFWGLCIGMLGTEFCAPILPMYKWKAFYAFFLLSGGDYTIFLWIKQIPMVPLVIWQRINQLNPHSFMADDKSTRACYQISSFN